MNVTVLFFAEARERAGTDRTSLELNQGERVSDAVAKLKRSHPALAPLWPHMAIAVNGALVRGDAALESGAELALLPPVSGG